MKVLQINSVCGYGSTGRIAVDIYNTLIDNQHDCKIIYGRGNAPEDVKAIKVGNVLNFYWEIFLTRVFDKHGYSSKNITKNIIKKIEEYDPDIIHLHNIHGYYLNIKILFDFLREYKKPIVWTLHDCWAFTGHCSYFTYPECNKWKIECNKCIRNTDYPKSLFNDNSKENYILKKKLFTSIQNLTLITPSQWLSNLVKESFFKKCDVKVINNGIDINKFKPTVDEKIYEKYNIPKDKKIILGIASKWDNRKGLKTFIELSECIDQGRKIVLVGLNKKQIKKLPKNIIGIERTNSISELAALYTIADVFVNPTLEDNFPTTNLEAIACGTPVITYNTGGSIEVINKNTGLIVENNTTKELYEKIKMTDNIKFNCLEDAKKYSKNIAYDKYIKLYNEILEDKNR